jgi:hypothetical protein
MKTVFRSRGVGAIRQQVGATESRRAAPLFPCPITPIPPGIVRALKGIYANHQ